MRAGPQSIGRSHPDTKAAMSSATGPLHAVVRRTGSSLRIVEEVLEIRLEDIAEVGDNGSQLLPRPPIEVYLIAVAGPGPDGLANDDYDLGRPHDAATVTHRSSGTDPDRNDRNSLAGRQVCGSVKELLDIRSLPAAALGEDGEGLTTLEDPLGNPKGRPQGCAALKANTSKSREHPRQRPVVPQRLSTHESEPAAGDGHDQQRVDVRAVNRRHDERAAGRESLTTDDLDTKPHSAQAVDQRPDDVEADTGTHARSRFVPTGLATGHASKLETPGEADYRGSPLYPSLGQSAHESNGGWESTPWVWSSTLAIWL